MKRKNIKVGEWIFCKEEKCLLKVKDIYCDDGEYIVHADSAKVTAILPLEDFRRPRISDLKPGDVFEVGNWQWTLTKEIISTAVASSTIAQRSCGCCTRPFSSKTKIRIITLADEKPEPEQHTTEVWANCFRTGAVDIYPSREFADTMAKKGHRQACKKLTITWHEGEGLNND